MSFRTQDEAHLLLDFLAWLRAQEPETLLLPDKALVAQFVNDRESGRWRPMTKGE